MEIGNIKLDLKYYTGDDTYSDGDIESEILDIIKAGKDVDDVLKSDKRWVIQYHLSPLRQNLLHSFSFTRNDSVLEVGAGCGAMTGLLCEKFNRVTAVELSKRRAEILAHRNKKRTNLEVVVGTIDDIAFKETYDVITLIGVLEYAGRYTNSKRPYIDFLAKIRALLKPQGQLIIAIENRYGLKYWAGFREDHLGTLFTSLEGYDPAVGIKTFSKMELEQILTEAGFGTLKYFYPMPDYKFATKIFSDNYDAYQDEFEIVLPNYDRDRIKLFDETTVLRNIVREKKLDFFANSFLIFAQNEVSYR